MTDFRVSDIYSLVSSSVLEIERLNNEILVSLEDLVVDQNFAALSAYVLSVAEKCGSVEVYCENLVKLLLRKSEGGEADEEKQGCCSNR